MTRAGFSLLEALISLSMLAFALLCVLPMLALPNMPAGSNRSLALSALIADRNLEAVRLWALQPANVNTLYPASANLQDPDHAGFFVSIHSVWLPMDWPLSPPAAFTNVPMPQCAQEVQVVVTWTEGIAQKQTQLVGVVGEATRNVASISIAVAPGSISKSAGGTATCTATLQDANGNPIEAQVTWRSVPHGAMGTFLVPSGGTTVTFQPTMLMALPAPLNNANVDIFATVANGGGTLTSNIVNLAVTP